MKRYAVLAGTSDKPGFQQKSLSDIYNFLKSAVGGTWLDREILIIPEGFDIPMLKFILSWIVKDEIDFLFLYFCGNENDIRTVNGFFVEGTEVKHTYLEVIGKKQVAVFDACTALIPDEDNDKKEKNDENDRQVEVARLLSDKAFSAVNGGLFLSGCDVGEHPVLGLDGSGLYTTHLIKEFCQSEKMLDFAVADRNARFVCKVAEIAAKVRKA